MPSNPYLGKKTALQQESSAAIRRAMKSPDGEWYSDPAQLGEGQAADVPMSDKEYSALGNPEDPDLKAGMQAYDQYATEKGGDPGLVHELDPSLKPEGDPSLVHELDPSLKPETPTADPGVYAAEGDPYTYEVLPSGKIKITQDGRDLGEYGPDGDSGGFYKAIMAQIGSGQLEQRAAAPPAARAPVDRPSPRDRR